MATPDGFIPIVPSPPPATVNTPIAIPLPYGISNKNVNFDSAPTPVAKTKTVDDGLLVSSLSQSFVGLRDNIFENTTGSLPVTGYRQTTFPGQNPTRITPNLPSHKKPELGDYWGIENVTGSMPTYLTSSALFIAGGGGPYAVEVDLEITIAAFCIKTNVPQSTNSEGKLTIDIPSDLAQGFLSSTNTQRGVVGVVDLSSKSLPNAAGAGFETWKSFTLPDQNFLPSSTSLTVGKFFNPEQPVNVFGDMANFKDVSITLNQMIYWVVGCYFGPQRDVLTPIPGAESEPSIPPYTKYLPIFFPKDFEIPDRNPFSLNIETLTQYPNYEGSSTQRLTNDNIIIEPSFDSPFKNTPCDVLMNNAEEGRPNPFIQDLDYATSTTRPVNYEAIISQSAIKSTVPESNYTQLSSTTPKYLGSKLTTGNYNLGDSISSQYCGGVHALYYTHLNENPKDRFKEFYPKGTLDMRPTIPDWDAWKKSGTNKNLTPVYTQVPNPNYGKWDPDGITGTVPRIPPTSTSAPTYGLTPDLVTDATPDGYWVLDVNSSNLATGPEGDDLMMYGQFDFLGQNFLGTQDYRYLNDPNLTPGGAYLQKRYIQGFQNDPGKAQEEGLVILSNTTDIVGNPTDPIDPNATPIAINSSWTAVFYTGVGFTFPRNGFQKSFSRIYNYNATVPVNFTYNDLIQQNNNQQQNPNYYALSGGNGFNGYANPLSFYPSENRLTLYPPGTTPAVGMVSLQYIINPDGTIQAIQNTDADLELIKSLVTVSQKTSPPFQFPLPPSNSFYFNQNTQGGRNTTSAPNAFISSSTQLMQEIRSVWGDPSSEKYLKMIDLGEYDKAEGTAKEDLSQFAPFGIRGTCLPFKLYNTIGLAMFNTGSSGGKNQKSYSVFNSTVKPESGSGTIDNGIFPGAINGGIDGATINLGGNTYSGGLGGFIYPGNIEFTDSKELPSTFLQILFDNNIVTPEALYKNKS